VEGTHDVFPFSLPLHRVVELLWPNCFGTSFHGNREWLSVLDIKGVKVWVPTLYLGGLSMVLALSAMRFRGVPAWRGWMTVIVGVSLIGSFGEFTSPLFWARLVPSVAEQVGPLDPPMSTPIRIDRYLRDGDGSLYWMMSTFLPGFRQFRFPSKLLTFTMLGLASLAGAGWDALASGDSQARRSVRRWALWLFGLTTLTLVASEIFHRPLIAWVGTRGPGGAFGPFDAPGAVFETQRGLAHAVLVYAVAVGLPGLVTRRPALAAALALFVTTVDLSVANARFVITAPQHAFEGVPKTLAIIEEDAKEHPFNTGQPYRIHRMPLWNPPGWSDKSSEDRVRDFVTWERETIQPKYGVPYGVQYTFTLGTAELYDYEWFFGGFLFSTVPEAATAIGVEPGERVIVFPRRSYDMWNTRYFIVPMYANNWTDENRGFASLLGNSTQVYPPLHDFRGPGGDKKHVEYIREHDYQIRRNEDCYPRAWVVHAGRFLKSMNSLKREERKLPMEEIIFSNEPFWRDSTRVVYDAKTTVWLEQEQQPDFYPYLDGGPPQRFETVTVTRHESDRVELDAVLDRPGVVVLADVYYPGWELTIDGKLAPVYRANRLMRGAAVPKGRHKLIYTFRPPLFRYGVVLSSVGLGVLVLLGIAVTRYPVASSLAQEPR
jgi:hypothetical protein